MEASQREKYKSGPFTKQRDTKYRGRGRKEMGKNARGLQSIQKRGRRGGEGGRVDKRYRPRGWKREIQT